MAYESAYLPEQTGNCPCSKDGCEKIGYQYADICIPIDLKPDAALGNVTVECCGEPCLECLEHSGQNACKVIVTQKVNVRIPIRCQVTACMGESTINCDCKCEHNAG